MIREVAIAVLFVAVSFSGEENKRPDVAENKGNEQVQSAPTKENHQTSTPNTSGTKDDAPKWYTSPEWWLVILGFPTLGFIGWQAWEMRKGGEVTNQQLQHLINAERAWIQVQEVGVAQKFSFIQFGPDAFFVWLHPYIENNGRTQARITSIKARADVLPKTEGGDLPRPPELPEQPQLSAEHELIKHDVILSPDQTINWIAISITRDDIELIKEREAFLYVYGKIDYRDLSETQRQTGFCRLYWIPYGSSDPVFAEGFVESAVIPTAYTICT